MKKMNIKNNKAMNKVGKWARTGAKFGVCCAGGYGPSVIAAAGANAVIPGSGLMVGAAKFGIEFAGFSVGFDATEDIIDKTSKAVKNHKSKKANKKHHHKETKTEEHTK